MKSPNLLSHQSFNHAAEKEHLWSPECFHHGWNQLHITVFQGSRQLRPLLRGDLQQQGDHRLECQLHGTKEPQDHAGQVGDWSLSKIPRNDNHSQKDFMSFRKGSNPYSLLQSTLKCKCKSQLQSLKHFHFVVLESLFVILFIYDFF